MKRLILLAFIMLFFANLSFASPSFTINVTDSMTVNTSDSGYIEISASSDTDDRFMISIVAEKPWMTLQDAQLVVPAGQTKTTKLYFSPTIATPPGTYKFTVVVESANTGERKSADTFITVYKNTFLSIDKVAVTGSLEPSGMARVEIYVRNTGKEAAEAQVDAVITSPANKKIYELHEVVAVGPSERKVVSKDFYLGDCAESGEYTVQLKLSYNGNEVDSFIQKFDVIKEPNIKIETSEHGFVTYEKIYSIKNTGNEVGSTVVTENVFGSIFYAGDAPDRIRNSVYEWDVDLSPCEQKVILYKMDYSPIAVIIAVLLAIWYVLFKFRTIRIRKMILQEKKIEQGSEFTVGIDIKAYMNAKDVVIRDFVPSAFNVKETAGPKPAKTKTNSGTVLVWHLDELKRSEERILDYKIVPIFGVHGRLHLPRASTTFRYFTRNIEKKSPPVLIGVHSKESWNLDEIFGKKEDEQKKIKLRKKKERPFPKYGGLLSKLSKKLKKKNKEDVEIEEKKK